MFTRLCYTLACSRTSNTERSHRQPLRRKPEQRNSATSSRRPKPCSGPCSKTTSSTGSRTGHSTRSGHTSRTSIAIVPAWSLRSTAHHIGVIRSCTTEIAMNGCASVESRSCVFKRTRCSTISLVSMQRSAHEHRNESKNSPHRHDLRSFPAPAGEVGEAKRSSEGVLGDSRSTRPHPSRCACHLPRWGGEGARDTRCGYCSYTFLLLPRPCGGGGRSEAELGGGLGVRAFFKTPSVFGCAESTFPAGAGKVREKRRSEKTLPRALSASRSRSSRTVRPLRGVRRRSRTHRA